jgi:hypothetical protein
MSGLNTRAPRRDVLTRRLRGLLLATHRFVHSRELTSQDSAWARKVIDTLNTLSAEVERTAPSRCAAPRTATTKAGDE